MSTDFYSVAALGACAIIAGWFLLEKLGLRVSPDARIRKYVAGIAAAERQKEVERRIKEIKQEEDEVYVRREEQLLRHFGVAPVSRQIAAPEAEAERA